MKTDAAVLNILAICIDVFKQLAFLVRGNIKYARHKNDHI